MPLFWSISEITSSLKDTFVSSCSVWSRASGNSWPLEPLSVLCVEAVQICLNEQFLIAGLAPLPLPRMKKKLWSKLGELSVQKKFYSIFCTFKVLKQVLWPSLKCEESSQNDWNLILNQWYRLFLLSKNLWQKIHRSSYQKFSKSAVCEFGTSNNGNSFELGNFQISPSQSHMHSFRYFSVPDNQIPFLHASISRSLARICYHQGKCYHSKEKKICLIFSPRVTNFESGLKKFRWWSHTQTQKFYKFNLHYCHLLRDKNRPRHKTQDKKLKKMVIIRATCDQ